MATVTKDRMNYHNGKHNHFTILDPGITSATTVQPLATDNNGMQFTAQKIGNSTSGRINIRLDGKGRGKYDDPPDGTLTITLMSPTIPATIDVTYVDDPTP